jgi:hypothetical protein
MDISYVLSDNVDVSGYYYYYFDEKMSDLKNIYQLDPVHDRFAKVTGTVFQHSLINYVYL